MIASALQTQNLTKTFVQVALATVRVQLMETIKDGKALRSSVDFRLHARGFETAVMKYLFLRVRSRLGRSAASDRQQFSVVHAFARLGAPAQMQTAKIVYHEVCRTLPCSQQHGSSQSLQLHAMAIVLFLDAYYKKKAPMNVRLLVFR